MVMAGTETGVVWESKEQDSVRIIIVHMPPPLPLINTFVCGYINNYLKCFYII
jgi:hypothetical protein